MTKKNLYHLLAVDIILLAAASILFKEPTALFIVCAAGALHLFLNKKDDWYMFIVGLVAGVLVEVVAVRSGIWLYPDTNTSLGIPYWMFVIWMIFSVSVYRVGVYLKK